MGIFSLFKHKSEAKPEVPQTALPEVEKHETEMDNEAVDTSLNDFVEDASPSSSGLYPQEILMLHYAPGFHPANNTFQKFWADQYGVWVPQVILDKLAAEGYIETAGVQETIAHLTTAKLKELLGQFGLSQTGKKAELVQRLSSMEDLSKLEAEYPERYYIYTPKGSKELEENQYIPYLHSHRNSIPLSIWKASKLVHEDGKERPFSEILLETLRAEAEVHRKACNFTQYRNACLAAYGALTDAKLPEEAFHCLCETAYYDLSSLQDGDVLALDESPKGQKMLIEAKLNLLTDRFLFVVPAVRQWFLQSKEEKGLSDEEFRSLLLQEFTGISIPFHVFSEEECADIILAILNDQTELPRELLERARMRLQEEIRIN